MGGIIRHTVQSSWLTPITQSLHSSLVEQEESRRHALCWWKSESGPKKLNARHLRSKNERLNWKLIRHLRLVHKTWGRPGRFESIPPRLSQRKPEGGCHQSLHTSDCLGSMLCLNPLTLREESCTGEWRSYSVAGRKQRQLQTNVRLKR